MGVAGGQDYFDGIGRAVQDARPRYPAKRNTRRGVCPPQLGHGAQNLGRLGHHDEQGAGSH